MTWPRKLLPPAIAQKRGEQISAAQRSARGSSRPRPARMLAIAAVWGACFALIRLGLRDATVLWFSSMRALIAGAALVAVAVAQRRPMPRGVRTWCLIVLLGITNTIIAFAAMFAEVDGLATGSAAVLAERTCTRHSHHGERQR